MPQSYDAYLISNDGHQFTKVVEQIIPCEDGWTWNCYPGFEAATKKEVAIRVLSCLDVIERNYPVNARVLDVIKYEALQSKKFFFVEQEF